MDEPRFLKSYYTDNGKIRLLKKLGSGKVGSVYRLTNRKCAKFYCTDLKGCSCDLSISKIKEMINIQIDQNVVLPKKLIYASKSKDNIIGYTMDYISGVSLSDIAKNDSFPIYKKHQIILSLIKTVMYIHSKGMMVGDYNLQNFIYKNKKVYFIDTDNFYCCEYSYDAIADFTYSKKYFFNTNSYDLVYCEFESLILMIHYFYTNDEAYLHRTKSQPEPKLKIKQSII